MTLRWIRALRRTLGKEVAKKISMRNKTLNVRKPGRRSCRARIGSAYDSPLVGYVRKLRVELIGLRHKRENQVTPVVGLQMAQSYQGEEHNSETSAHCGEVLSKKWETGGNALALFWTSVCLAYPGEIRYVGREIYDPGWEIYDPVSYVRRGGRGKAKGSRYGSKTHDPAKTLQILDDPAQEAAGEMDEDKRDVYPVI
ncbi:hypothetical protein PC115_g10754 [Phytophthora cactorum]|uniref:Uncharacterized protein n=1 Tax=Phytophthora cactorum TaxID=29920 RepID=A0A8T1CB39_9STRA|nr:hypothetical protein PC115_g10754 [Phytophthora cactorum]